MKQSERFDCVAMMHKGQEAVRKRLQGMSQEEQLAYWGRKHTELLEKQKRLRKEQVAHSSH